MDFILAISNLFNKKMVLNVILLSCIMLVHCLDVLYQGKNTEGCTTTPHFAMALKKSPLERHPL